jgi:hypothetical protein
MGSDRHREFFNTPDFERVDNLNYWNSHGSHVASRIGDQSESTSSYSLTMR